MAAGKSFKPSRIRKRKVLARMHAQDNAKHESPADTNVVEILPADRKKVEEQKAQLKAELKQAGVKVSSKKAKRLEKYIENKLKKDENKVLRSKLATQKMDTSLFMSTKTLGQGKETKRQALGRALREERAGLDGDHDLLYEPRADVEEDLDGEDEFREENADSLTAAHLEAISSTAEPPVFVAPAVVGSGLKRKPESDNSGRPVLQKRQKRGGIKSKASLKETQQSEEEAEDDEDEWNGISGDDSVETLARELKGNRQTLKSDGLKNETMMGSDDESTTDSETSSELNLEDEPTDDEEDSAEEDSKPTAFKIWAQEQRNKALQYNPVVAFTSQQEIPKPSNFTPRAPEQEPLPLELQPGPDTRRKAFNVAVSRPPDIQEARMKLPVVREEQKIMEAIHNFDVVVICGSTGSGKTTQVPQFLYEAGYGAADSENPGMIGITQPRRVAAVSMSKRVATELGDHGRRVAYQIRYDNTVDPNTGIKFMTDGVLVREAEDILLQKYSAIIVDEAHERSHSTDILIGLLSRAVRARNQISNGTVKPLKLIIMSATLQIDEITRNKALFATPPPVIGVEGRQYPVTTHFARRTEHDYVQAAFKKVSKAHRKLPPGDILVFLTGQNEIHRLQQLLWSEFQGRRLADGPRVVIPGTAAAIEAEDVEFGEFDGKYWDEIDDYGSADEDGDDEAEFEIEDEGSAPYMELQILTLYSLLPTKEQFRVFELTPARTRRVILATNVAETSLTIPGVRYVFDCGRSKERRYDPISGVQSYEVGWISKASASQRAGRAGRTGPGHCYRLYSSAVYERDFPQFAEPEILRMPLEDIILQLRAIEVKDVTNFPFPTPPDRDSLEEAQKRLTYLRAISLKDGQLTNDGAAMANFPLSPRFARMLLYGFKEGCLPYTVAMVAALSAGEVFLPENQVIPDPHANEANDAVYRTQADVAAESHQADQRRRFNAVHKKFCSLDDWSDAVKLLEVVRQFAHEPTEAWCESHFVRYKALSQAQQLRRQLSNLLTVHIPKYKAFQFQDKLSAPNPKQVEFLKLMAAVGFVDQVAIRADLAPSPPEQSRKPRRAIDVPYLPLTPLADTAHPAVYIHPSSPLAHLSPKECPQYIIYAYLQRAAASPADAARNRAPKTRMHGLTNIAGLQLYSVARSTPLIRYGKPTKELAVRGPSGLGQERDVLVVPYLRAEGRVGGEGWPLPLTQVKQKKEQGRGWVVIE